MNARQAVDEVDTADHYISPEERLPARGTSEEFGISVECSRRILGQVIDGDEASRIIVAELAL